MKEARVDEEGRECCECGTYKPWQEYNRNAGGREGRDNRCRECTRAWRASPAYREANRERSRKAYADPAKREAQKARMRAYYAKQDVKDKRHSEGFRAEEREREKARLAGMGAEEREAERAAKRDSQRRMMLDPMRRLSSRVSSDMRKRLRGRGLSKGKKHWEDLVGYGVDELKARLEGLFEPGMTWENYGEWHVDHVVPVAAHEFEEAGDDGFKRCWALDNLAPRWATTDMARRHGSGQVGNQNKGAKLTC